MFSVIIPLKTNHKYLKHCLKGLSNQTLSPNEILFIFNNAELRVKEFTKNFATKNFQKSKLIFLESHKEGPGAARNIGFLNANENFLAFLDSDDIWPINYLETRKSYILKNNAQFTASDTIIFDSRTNKGYLRSSNKLILNFEDFSKGNPISTSSTIISKKLMRKIGGFSHLKKRNDFATWLKASKFSSCEFIKGGSPVFIIKRSNSLSSYKISLLKYNYLSFRGIGLGKFASLIRCFFSIFYSFYAKIYWNYINKKNILEYDLSEKSFTN